MRNLIAAAALLMTVAASAQNVRVNTGAPASGVPAALPPSAIPGNGVPAGDPFHAAASLAGSLPLPPSMPAPVVSDPFMRDPTIVDVKVKAGDPRGLIDIRAAAPRGRRVVSLVDSGGRLHWVELLTQDEAADLALSLAKSPHLESISVHPAVFDRLRVMPLVKAYEDAMLKAKIADLGGVMFDGSRAKPDNLDHVVAAAPHAAAGVPSLEPAPHEPAQIAAAPGLPAPKRPLIEFPAHGKKGFFGGLLGAAAALKLMVWGSAYLISPVVPLYWLAVGIPAVLALIEIKDYPGDRRQADPHFLLGPLLAAMVATMILPFALFGREVVAGMGVASALYAAPALFAAGWLVWRFAPAVRPLPRLPKLLETRAGRALARFLPWAQRAAALAAGAALAVAGALLAGAAFGSYLAVPPAAALTAAAVWLLRTGRLSTRASVAAWLLAGLAAAAAVLVTTPLPAALAGAGVLGLAAALAGWGGSLFGGALNAFARLKTWAPEERLKDGADIWQTLKAVGVMLALIGGAVTAAALLVPA